MSLDISDFATADLLALGEPTHAEPAFQRVRNDLLARLAGHGYRSIVLESDRVAGLLVNDYVQGGDQDLDAVLRDGFSHNWGSFEGNRELVVWLRDHNATRPPGERIAFHGFDAPTENMSAPSPRTYLEHARDYLGLDLDIAGLAGDDERWSRTEAILDAAQSPGDVPELRALADDLLIQLYARAPELIAATSRDAWFRAETWLTGGIALLRYHRQAAIPMERDARVSGLLRIRDAIMAQNLLAIRRIEAPRGRTLVNAHNLHLQRNPGRWELADLDLRWHGAGSILAAQGEQFTVIAGSLGSSAAITLAAPPPGTYERFLSPGLTRACDVPDAATRTDPTPPQGYFPLDRATLDGVDAVLHVTD